MIDEHGDKEIGKPEVFYANGAFDILDYELTRMTRSVFYNQGIFKRSIAGLYILNFIAIFLHYTKYCG